MSTLRSTITDLASRFATDLLQAMRNMSLDELMAEVGRDGRRAARGGAAPKRGAGGRLPRRSAADIEAVVNDIVGLLQKNPKGLRAEQIREALRLDAKELPKPLSEALADKRITKKGQKRATTYFAGPKKG
jgi:hypothetical protein